MSSAALLVVRIIRRSPLGHFLREHLNRCAAYHVFGPLELPVGSPKLSLSHVLGIEPFPDLRSGEVDLSRGWKTLH